MVRWVIFDFDGTIVDSADVIVDAYNSLAPKFNARTLDPRELPQLMKMPLAARCRYLNFKLYKFPLFALEVYSIYRQSLHRLRLFDGMRDVLAELHRRDIGTAVISTNSEHNIREFFARNGIGVIQEVMCSNHLFGKDKEIAKFLKKRGVKSSDVLYVGDEARDIIACRKNRVPVVWASWGYDDIANIRKNNPDHIADRPAELLEIVRSSCD